MIQTKHMFRNMTQGMLCCFLAVHLTHAETNETTGAAMKKPSQTEIALLYDDVFLQHRTGPGHPERPDRLKKTVARIREDQDLVAKVTWPSFSPASKDAIGAVHTTNYIALARAETQAVEEGEFVQLSTGDTMLSSGTWDAAWMAAGGAMAAVDAVATGQHPAAFALVRPPGHHASADRGMGFCLFNNIAIAARHAQREYGIERVLIVDIDVHHGNGTQDIFYEDDSVYFFCVHQHPLYPGSGRPTERGSGRGEGYTQNIDLPAGAGDDDILLALENKLLPAMETFQPQLILVSAGFDGHGADPLGGLQYTEQGYARMAGVLQDLAKRYADGRIAFILEGGYDTTALADSIAAILQELAP